MALTKANAFFSMILYFKGASLSVLLKNAIGCSKPWSFFCSRTAAMVCSEANEKIIKSFLKSGLISIGVFVKACLMDSNDCFASTVHFKTKSFLACYSIL